MSEKEIYLYLDLNGKLDVNYFHNDKIFFKMINIDKKPMVQIGNYVFEGKYEDYLGTKVFFMENKEYKPSDNFFEKESPIHLKYLTKTAKVLQLKWKSVPVTAAQESKVNEEYMDLKFKETYNAVLEKFERAELNIKDISVKSRDTEEKLEETQEEKLGQTDDVETKIVKDNNRKRNEEMEVDFESKTDDDNLTKDKIFKDYISLPKKQIEQQKVYEIKEENLLKVVDASNYPVLKQIFLQNVSLDDIDINKNDFNKYVNVEKSVREGVIPETEVINLTDDLINKLLNSDNFDNFTVPMKMAYLLVQLDEYKKLIRESQDKNILKQVDEFGRTFLDKYRLLKQLIKDLWYIVYLNNSV